MLALKYGPGSNLNNLWVIKSNRWMRKYFITCILIAVQFVSGAQWRVETDVSCDALRNHNQGSVIGNIRGLYNETVVKEEGTQSINYYINAALIFKKKHKLQVNYGVKNMKYSIEIEGYPYNPWKNKFKHRLLGFHYMYCIPLLKNMDINIGAGLAQLNFHSAKEVRAYYPKYNEHYYQWQSRIELQTKMTKLVYAKFYGSYQKAIGENIDAEFKPKSFKPYSYGFGLAVGIYFEWLKKE